MSTNESTEQLVQDAMARSKRTAPAKAPRVAVATANMGTVLEVMDRCPTCKAAVREALAPALAAHLARRAEFRALVGGDVGAEG